MMTLKEKKKITTYKILFYFIFCPVFQLTFNACGAYFVAPPKFMNKMIYNARISDSLNGS